jgi:hypothetical protein
MPKFRKKPITVEAEQYSRARQIKEGYLPPGAERNFSIDDDGARYETLPHVQTLEGRMLVSDGDWIIKGVKGEFYPCKDEIFRATYELVASDAGDNDVSSPQVLSSSPE